MDNFGKKGLKLSIEAFCLTDASLHKLAGEPMLRASVSGHGVRKFAAVHRDTGAAEVDHYFADIVTGQLYGEDLICRSSDILRLDGAPTKTGKLVPKYKPAPT